MKNLIKTFSFLALLFSAVFIVSCSDDDPVLTLNVDDFTTTIDENQAVDAVLGSVAATGNDGTFSYSITSQSPAGSVAINASTGELSVADASAFDFETNPTITATISVMGNSITETATATIALNDIDDLEFLLTDSEAAYTAANDGDWVLITENEYNMLASSLNEISRIGTSEAQYTSTNTSTNTTEWTVSNDTDASAPSNSYILAFKYYLKSGTDVTDFKLKQSETIDDSYTNLGNALPVHSGTDTSVHFILKGSSSQLTSEGYLAINKPSGAIMGIVNNVENYYFITGDNNTGFQSFTGYLSYQGLSTTQKQW